jgi:hypothetical protein
MKRLIFVAAALFPSLAAAQPPQLPLDATFPATDPNMVGITDAYASSIAEEMMFCGMHSQQWAATIQQAINLDLMQASSEQRSEFTAITAAGRAERPNLIAVCDALAHPTHIALIESMNAFVVQANNN